MCQFDGTKAGSCAPANATLEKAKRPIHASDTAAARRAHFIASSFRRTSGQQHRDARPTLAGGQYTLSATVERPTGDLLTRGRTPAAVRGPVAVQEPCRTLPLRSAEVTPAR